MDFVLLIVIHCHELCSVHARQFYTGDLKLAVFFLLKLVICIFQPVKSDLGQTGLLLTSHSLKLPDECGHL